MNDSEEYNLQWRGIQKGPWDLPTIRASLKSGDIHSMFQIHFHGGWVTLRDFLEDQEKREAELATITPPPTISYQPVPPPLPGRILDHRFVSATPDPIQVASPPAPSRKEPSSMRHFGLALGLVLGVIAVGLSIFAIIKVRTQPLASNDEATPLEDADEGQESIEKIIAEAKGFGTGFFITADGYLITNSHVVNGASKLQIRIGKVIRTAHLIQEDEAHDLALLKVSGKFAALPIAPSAKVALGSSVATLGFPNIAMQGFSAKYSKGEIASLTGVSDDQRFFQISVPIQPGNSGSALVNSAGNVIGVINSKLNAKMAFDFTGDLPQNVNYAVKSAYLTAFLDSLPELKLKLIPPSDPKANDPKNEDLVNDIKMATVLVIVF